MATPTDERATTTDASVATTSFLTSSSVVAAAAVPDASPHALLGDASGAADASHSEQDNDENEGEENENGEEDDGADMAADDEDDGAQATADDENAGGAGGGDAGVEAAATQTASVLSAVLLPARPAPSAAAGAASEETAKVRVENFPDRFPSWEALEEFVQEFKETTYQMFIVHTACPVSRRNADMKKRKWHTTFNNAELIPEHWKHYRRVFNCTHWATSQRSQGKGLRKRKAFRGTGCTATLSAVVRYDTLARCHYIHVKVSGWHNHPCDRKQFFAYSENRRITEPGILNEVRRLADRGLTATAILARVSALIKEIKGEECVLTRKDMQNLMVRLKNEKKQAMAAAAAADGTSAALADAVERGANGQGAAASAGDAQGDDDDNGGDLTAGDSDAEENPSKRRKVDETALSDSEDAALTALRQKKSQGLKLSRLQVVLDSPYSYLQAHEDIEKVVVARAEQLPHTISAFRHDIVGISRSDTEDVDFVLPKYVLYGCENGIINHCKFHRLTPPSVGVRLPVVKRNAGRDEPASVVTLSSRQLRAMKQFYFARQSILDVKRTTEWVRAATFRTCPPPPFDDYFYYDKETILQAIQLMPLTRVVLRGMNLFGKVAQEFTDAIHGINVLRFGSSANVDIDGVKAVTLALHSRFHGSTSFLCPTFNFESSLEASRVKARAYGGFSQRKDCVAGAVQLMSRRWGSFFLSWSKKTCCVYATSKSEYDELRALLVVQLREFAVRVAFEFAPAPAPTSATGAPVDSGVLALLFLEVVLLNKTWADVPLDAIEYFRVRCLMQAIQVVNKQDVHDIQWA